MDSSLRPLVIIDDNEDDLFILQVVLQKAGILHPVRPFGRAEDAVAFLSTLGGDDAKEMLPLACFVDVRMTGFNGFEFIEWVRNHHVFDPVPLIVTSSSEHPNDLQRAATLGAQCYVLKYPAAAAMRELIRESETYRVADGTRTVFTSPVNLFLGRDPLPKVQ